MPRLSTADGKSGLKAEYSEPRDGFDAQPGPVLATRIETNVNLSQSSVPSQLVGKKTIAVQWTGSIMSAETGDYLVGVRGIGFGTLTIDGKQVARLVAYDDVEVATGRVHLVQGQKAQLALHYSSMPNARARSSFGSKWMTRFLRKRSPPPKMPMW